MMTYMRDFGLKILFVLIVLAALAPSALPQRLYRSVTQAQSALEHNRPTQALTAIEQALAFDPAVQGLREPALDLAITLGEWDRAETHLLALKELDPSTEVFRCAELQMQLARGEFPASTTEMSALSAACPGMIDSLREFAYDLFDSGQFDAAVPLLENLLTLEPESSREQTMLALYAGATDPENAVDQLRIAQATESLYARLSLELLILIQDTENIDTPAYRYALSGLAFARADEWYLAHEAFQNAVRLAPEYAQAWGYLGVSKDKIGLNGEEALLEAVRLSPADPPLLILEAMHYNRRGDASIALPILEHAAALDGENPAIAAELGQTFASLGDLESARMAYRQATLLAPDEPSFWHMLAEFSLHNEIDIAAMGLPAARNALILQPFSSQSWRSLGYAHYLLEDFSLAQRALLRAVDITPADPTVQYYLGLLFQAQGRSDKAIDAWTMASRLAPDHIYAQLSQRALENLIRNH